ncbi:hypothetical protein HY967_04980 [Candidatus Jorgensenbacteria bacterium]|nr:hypothetical protein [Candidatus Jorgensenbacteria bacterium]
MKQVVRLEIIAVVATVVLTVFLSFYLSFGAAMGTLFMSVCAFGIIATVFGMSVVTPAVLGILGAIITAPFVFEFVDVIQHQPHLAIVPLIPITAGLAAVLFVVTIASIKLDVHRERLAETVFAQILVLWLVFAILHLVISDKQKKPIIPSVPVIIVESRVFLCLFP